MLTCVILHNMIIENERPNDSDEDLESDEEEDDIIMHKKSLVWERLTNEHFEPVGRDGHNLEGFMDRSDYAQSTL